MEVPNSSMGFIGKVVRTELSPRLSGVMDSASDFESEG